MKYGRTFNFSAGPAMMPEPVLEEIRDEMMTYRGSGMCVMEMSLSLIHISEPTRLLSSAYGVICLKK